MFPVRSGLIDSSFLCLTAIPLRVVPLNFTTRRRGEEMKAHTWMCTPAVCLTAALAMPSGIFAQENNTLNHKAKHHTYKLIDLGTFGGHDSLLSAGEVAVTHELGHALCNERNEKKADRYGELLRKGQPLQCK